MLRVVSNDMGVLVFKGWVGWSCVVFVEDGLVSLFGFLVDEFFLAIWRMI